MIRTQIDRDKVSVETVTGAVPYYGRTRTPIIANMFVDINDETTLKYVLSGTWNTTTYPSIGRLQGGCFYYIDIADMTSGTQPMDWDLFFYLESTPVPGTQIKIWTYAWAYCILVYTLAASILGNETGNPTNYIRLGSAKQKRYGSYTTLTYFENTNINPSKFWVAERSISGAEDTTDVNTLQDETHKDNQQGAENNRQDVRTPEHRERIQEEDSNGESGQSDRSKDSKEETEKQKPKGQRNNRKKTSD